MNKKKIKTQQSKVKGQRSVVKGQRSVVNKGFTLIEFLLVIGITVILAGVASVVYGNLQVSAQLNETSAQMAQNLRLAREQSIAGLNNVAHGIKFDAGQYTLFQGASYLSREYSYDRVYPLDSALTITTTLSGNEIVFSKGVGAPSASGTITLSHSVSGSREVSVNSQGIIEEQ